MREDRFLVVKLSSLGDLVFTLPAVAALRESFPQARIDWLVERRWQTLLSGNPDVSSCIPLDSGSPLELLGAIRGLRTVGYTCAFDFQGLYKSAFLALASGAPRRLGFARGYAREPAASFFYTQSVAPGKVHMVEQNLALARAAGARSSGYRFSLYVPAEADQQLAQELAARGASEFYVLSPGGGWRSKCWPPERFGDLHRELARRFGWRGVVSYGPGEEALAEEVHRAAGDPEPIVLGLDLAQLMALLRGAKLVVAADTGPLHLAVALGTPVVGLYGPTAPWRNSPFSSTDVVVRNAGPEETTLRRGNTYSRAMLSISVEQVVEAIGRRVGLRE